MAEISPDVADVERAIRAYLETHPHALDTVRGIREWWLRDTCPRCSPPDVEAAIGRLLAAGAVAEHALPGGQRGYSNPRAIGAAPDRNP